MSINNVNNIKFILNVIRRVTTIVKVIPFVVALFLLVDIVLQMRFSADTTDISDLVVYQSPLNIAFLLILSYCLKLCIWHRLECLLPLLPFVSVYIDEHLCELSQSAAYTNYAVVTIVFAASLINAYFVFIKPNRIKRK